jgi:hypothetical protein
MSGRDERRMPRKKTGDAGATRRSEAMHAGGTGVDFASYVWRLIGTLRTEAGWLDLTAGRLRYTTETREVFDVRLDEVTDVDWPWYYFGGGVKLMVHGEQYRFSFVLPNGAEYPTARMQAAAGSPAALAIVAQKGNDIARGRKAGKEWQQLLEQAGHPAAPPITRG